MHLAVAGCKYEHNMDILFIICLRFSPNLYACFNRKMHNDSTVCTFRTFLSYLQGIQPLAHFERKKNLSIAFKNKILHAFSTFVKDQS